MTPQYHSSSASADSVIDPWFAVKVKTRSEPEACALLANKGFESFLPTYLESRTYSDRIRHKEVALFPGYVFCKFDPKKKVPILETPSVIGIVSFGGALAPVDDSEIAALQTVMRSGVHCEPWWQMAAGDRVHLDAGPLAGLTGTLIEVRRSHRLLISVTLLNRSVLAEIDPRWVSALREVNPTVLEAES